MSAQWIIKGLDPVGVEKHGVCSHTFFTRAHIHARYSTSETRTQ